MRAMHRYAYIASLTAALGASFVVAGCAGGPKEASLGEQVDDTVITSKIKTAFVQDPAVSNLNISVETFKGTVQLSGFANNQTEISRAVEIASDVQGVRSVKNDIRLKAAAN
jgi:osmotically-inducible protein OsmY